MSSVVGLSWELGVSPEEFATAWNADPNRPSTAQVVFEEQHGEQSDNPAAMVQLLGERGNCVASGTILDFLKDRFPDRVASHKLHVLRTEYPNAWTVLLVIIQDEGLAMQDIRVAETRREAAGNGFHAN
ncbi:MAG: hypothetical protein ACLQVD_02585 [Capsulimonadaceae bacterium]